MTLQDKVVVITGGASGIGRAATLAFLHAGAKVAFTYATSGAEAMELVKSVPGKAASLLALQADLTQPADVDRVFEATISRFGSVDVLVANAGGLLARKRCVETSLEFWNQAFALNVTSAFLCCQAALKHMEPAKSGNIVLISSLAAFDGGGPGASHYAAAKGAIATYTRALAKEVGPLGIRVNGVAPGLIATRFHDVFNTPQGRQMTVDRTPLRREGQPEDVAKALLYLASSDSSFITGETIQINGGLAVF
jgi:3-oxoacyl-[acyl-carrier protein] reductase